MDPLAGLTGPRRNEDIALDMMKFIASTTNYGKKWRPARAFTAARRTNLRTMPPSC